MKPITVLLAEDHAILREGLRSLLALGSDIEVIGEAADGRQAVALARELRPTVVVMDISMPLLNGFEATRQILLAAPKTKVLVLSAHCDDGFVTRMVAAGACGYVAKQNSGQLLLRAIRESAGGNPYFSPAISRRLENAERKFRENGSSSEKYQHPLTPRQAEVLQRIAEGAANKQVAAELGISIKTVEKHRQQLMRKLDIHDTAGLTRHAIATGVIESSVQLMIA